MSLRDDFVAVIRRKHYSLRTERTYWAWIMAFLRFHHTASGDRPSLFGLVAAACVAGCVGSWAGSQWLQSISVPRLRLVEAMLLAVALMAAHQAHRPQPSDRRAAKATR